MSRGSQKFAHAEVTVVPDRSNAATVLRYGCCPFDRVRQACLELLYRLSGAEADGAAFYVTYILQPCKMSNNKNAPIRVLLTAFDESGAAKELLHELVAGSGLAGLFSIVYGSNEPFLSGDLTLSATILRKEEFPQASVEKEFNPFVPERLFVAHTLAARPEHDYSVLKDIWDFITSPLIVQISAAPINKSQLVRAHACYVRELRECDSAWSDGEYAFSPTPLQPDPLSSYDQQIGGRLQYRRDPLAEQAIRKHDDISRMLHEPVLGFRACSYSQNAKEGLTALQMVASSAFLPGSYTVLDTATGKRGSGIGTFDPPREWAIPVTDCESYLPRGCGELKCVAAPNELASLFTLPVGGGRRDFPFRLDTDPPVTDSQRSLSFGMNFYGAKYGETNV